MATPTAPAIGASKEAIQSHYDLSNEFYHLWLDPQTRCYSAALFEPEDDFITAQQRKVDYHITQAASQGAANVLDIGCGWGGTLESLVRKHDVQHAVGLTLSDAQKLYIDTLGLPGVDVRVENWQDHQPSSRYDSIISVGAFEHFANLDQTVEQKVAGYRAFFQRCHGWLVEGGRISLQTITYENSTREDFSPFFANEIFPESDLPRMFEIIQAADGLFEVERLRNDRMHYYLTQKAWWQALKRNKQIICERFGQAVYDRYNLYLQMCMVGFKTGSMGLVRITFKRIDRPAQGLR
ncbi:SAM-dependent methyltransferase [Pseudomonas entomophila]|uniref:Cyclopropane-fatty-acyl-phospholipid synthase family protein n=2 Tax=Pseudomonas entomophila TaxID=312306 RepID=A0ABY9QQ87_9PSED|nr:cyclopropane-fatty-acyl-phospholipid synthase family protein [Pseudomonas entomophila]WMW06176.1 cyclopropane-fatty-acyl-phospholipid synthase family protein [Pseudomonas entomophila]CAK18140.1 putative Cyclopropane-fatty-acyl-phospholipid synthase [Pseudomonas entomophila L48]